MKPLYLLLAGACLIAFSTPSNAQYFPEHVWSQRYGDVGADAANGIAVDIDQRIIVVGSFEGSIDCGGGPLTSAGGSDVFVAVFNSDGSHVWSKRFGGTGADVAHGLIAEGTHLGGGNYVFDYTVTGSFEETVNFGGSNLASAGGSDAFVARFDGVGAQVWSARSGDAGDDAGYSLASLGAKNVVVTGSVTDTQTGFTDAFLARYDAAGAEQWSQEFGGPLDDAARCVGYNGSRIAISGEFRDQASFGGSSLVSAGGEDIFVANYDAAGTHISSKRFGGTQDDSGLALQIVFSTNRIYCTGYFGGTVNFGGSNLNSAGGEDVFLLRLDSSGAHEDSRRYGGVGNDAGTGLVVESNVNIVGRFENSVYFGNQTLTSHGGSDGFIAMFSHAGVNRRNIRLGGTGNDLVRGVATFNYLYPSPAYDLVFAGKFMNTMDLGGGPLSSAGGDDAFVVYYAEAWLTPVGPTLPNDRLTVSSFPNPFNPMTTISYSLPSEGRVSIAIFDVNGARVATLVQNENRIAGPHEVRWEGRTDDGVPTASGVYFAQVDHAGARQSVRLVLLK